MLGTNGQLIFLPPDPVTLIADQSLDLCLEYCDTEVSVAKRSSGKILGNHSTGWKLVQKSHLSMKIAGSGLFDKATRLLAA